MAEITSDTHDTIAIEFEIPTPRNGFARVKRWLLSRGSTTSPYCRSPLNGRGPVRADLEKRTDAMYVGSW